MEFEENIAEHIGLANASESNLLGPPRADASRPARSESAVARFSSHLQDVIASTIWVSIEDGFRHAHLGYHPGSRSVMAEGSRSSSRPNAAASVDKEGYVIPTHREMTTMMRSVRLKMHRNVQNLITDYAESELPVNLHTVYADQMYAQVWPDAKMSLLSNSSPNGAVVDEPVPESVWELVKEMDRFYNFLCEFRPLPPCEVGVWAMPFVDRWLRSLQKRSRKHLILAAIDKKLPARITSPTDCGSTPRLVTRLNVVIDEFKELPYNQDHLQRFTKFLTRLFDRYLEALVERIQHHLDAEHEKGENWGYAAGYDGRCQVSLRRELFEKLNDLYAIPNAIKEVRAQLDLDGLAKKSYDPSATLRRQSSPSKFEARTLTRMFDVLVISRVPKKCDVLCGRLVEGMTLFTCDRLSRLVSRDKREGFSKQDLYEGPMQPIMNDLIPKFDQFSSFAEQSLAREIWSRSFDHLMQHLKKELSPADVNDVPTVMQIRRVSYITDILLELFKREYTGDDEHGDIFASSKSRRDVIELSEFLVSGTDELIAEFERLPRADTGFWSKSKTNLNDTNGGGGCVKDDTKDDPISGSSSSSSGGGPPCRLSQRLARPLSLLKRRELWVVLRHRAESLQDRGAIAYVLKHQNAEDTTREKLRRQLSHGRSQRLLTATATSSTSSSTTNSTTATGALRSSPPPLRRANRKSFEKVTRSKTMFFFGRDKSSATETKPKPKSLDPKKTSSSPPKKPHKRSRTWFFFSSKKSVGNDEDVTAPPASPPKAKSPEKDKHKPNSPNNVSTAAELRVAARRSSPPSRRSNARTATHIADMRTTNPHNDDMTTTHRNATTTATKHVRKYPTATMPLRRSNATTPHIFDSSPRNDDMTTTKHIRKYSGTYPRRRATSAALLVLPPRKQSSHKDINAVMLVIDERRRSGGTVMESP